MIDRADSLYRTEDLSASLLVYQQAFALAAPTAPEAYNAACVAALLGEDSTALALLDWSLSLGWTNADHLRRDTDLSGLRALPEWSAILQRADANKRVADERYPNPELKRQLEVLNYRDQVLRQLLAEATAKFGEGTAEMNTYWDLMRREDSLCWLALEELLEAHGWPGKSTVGGQANTAAWLIVQHAPLEKQVEYVKWMEASVKEGESQGAQLAMLYDRIQMRLGKPQRYGSQVQRNADGKREIYPLEDATRVNQWRAEVGLGSLEDYARKMGLEWSLD